MSSATMKVSNRTRDRIKAIAESSGKSMAAVVDKALNCYEAGLQEQAYLDEWERFARENPEGFSEYMNESKQIEEGLNDLVPN